MSELQTGLSEIPMAIAVEKRLPWKRRLGLLGEGLGIDAEQVEDLAFGEAVLELPEDRQYKPGTFATSANAYLDADDDVTKAEADKAFYYDVHTFLFEVDVDKGHAERIRYPYDPVTGRGIMYGKTSFLEVYALDLSQPQHKWRQQLSFIECMNEATIMDLTRDDTLRRNVFVEFSTFPYGDDISESEVEQYGYKPKNHKGYIRVTYLEGDERVVETLSMSDMRPEEVAEFYEAFGNTYKGHLTPQGVLSEPQLFNLETYQQCGGIGFFAAVLDRIKETRIGNERQFGEDVPRTNSDVYFSVMQVSSERRERAKPVVDECKQKIADLHVMRRLGLLTEAKFNADIESLLLAYRLEVFKNDPQLAREQCREATADAINILRILEAEGRYSEALDLTAVIQEELGTAYACGMMIKVGKDGNRLDCIEIRNGQKGRCPSCKNVVRIIVDAKNNDKLYCSDPNCRSSRTGGKKIATSIFAPLAKTGSKPILTVR